MNARSAVRRIERAKHLYRAVDQRAGTLSDELPLISVSIHRGATLRSDHTSDAARAEDLRTYKVCERGDIVLNRMRAFQGAVGISPERGLVRDYLVLRPRDAVEGSSSIICSDQSGLSAR